METTIEIPRIESLNGNPGYNDFVEDLQLVYNLGNLTPNELKWVDMKSPSTSFGAPQVILAPEDGVPQLAVNLYPINDESVVTGHVSYQTPLLLRGVDRWKDSPLRGHKITHWRGRPESESRFQKKDAYPLAEMLEGIVTGIDDTTAVVESIALLPISNNRSYITEFLPEIRTEVGQHRDYKIAVLMEGGFSAYSALTRGQNRPIHDMDEHQTKKRWQADLIADMSDIERILLPDSSGHMILIAEPVQEKQKYDFRSSPGFGDDFGYGGDSLMRGGPQMFGGGMKGGVSIGGVSISSGSSVGSASMYDGELQSSSAGKPIIYHTRFLGVKADQIAKWGIPELDQLAGSLSSYDIEQN